MSPTSFPQINVTRCSHGVRRADARSMSMHMHIYRHMHMHMSINHACYNGSINRLVVVCDPFNGY